MVNEGGRRWERVLGSRERPLVVEAWRLGLTRRSPWNSAWLLYLKALLLYSPHAMVKRLHRRDVCYAVILIPQTADLLGLCEVAGLVGRIRPGCPVPATGGSLP